MDQLEIQKLYRSVKSSINTIMALPSAFENETEFFSKVLHFLKQNQHFYNYPNTDVLIENVFEIINIADLEKISIFNKDFDLTTVPEIKTMVEHIENLTMFYERQTYVEAQSDYFENASLSVKKKHEVCFLSQEIHKNCEEYGCDTIVDLGCGLGYLDQLLFKKYNYKILGLEYNDTCIRGAKKRQKSYYKESIDHVKYVKHFVDDNSSVAIVSLLEEHFPKSTKICIVGLHACADLTIHAINIFMKMVKAECLVLMSCCYHKMSLKDSVVNERYEFCEACDERKLLDLKEIEISSKSNETIESDEHSKHSIDENYVTLYNKAKKFQKFNHFPLSEALKSEYNKNNGEEFLRIPFLRLAAQPPSVNEDINTLVFRLLSRAVLQLYCFKNNQRLVKNKRRAIKLISQTGDFSRYLLEATQGYSLKCDSKSCISIIRPSQKDAEGTSQILESCKCATGFDIGELTIMWQHISCDLTVKKGGIFILLQRHLQPMFENLVLFDRIQFLRENGIENCGFLKIVDEKVSPRCLALVCAK